ncbi:hypothetical protein [Beijerinckia sp. L45]|uniref:hypothetical protein n=1 Tax=Beijerinckia sp. L45 TaxID=1641855 RepID=UPI00131BCF0E|nr:hypothetical protein [Beijerinckia sp. L45]
MRAQGIFVPVLPAVAQMAGNAKLLATVLDAAPTLSFQRVFPHIDSRALDPARIVEELLADWRPDQEALILSAEDFRPTHAARLQHLLPAADFTVVLVARTQDQWFESYHNQLMKTGDVHQDLPSFIAVTLSRNTERLCYPDWWAHFDGWRQALGNCSVQLYDEARSDLFGSFFKAAGLPTPSGIAEIPRQRESMSLHQLTYLSVLESDTPLAAFVRRRAASAQAADRLGGPEAKVLRLRERAFLADYFASSNARLLEALGRPADDGALRFSEPAQEPPTIDEVRDSEPYRRHETLANDIYASMT